MTDLNESNFLHNKRRLSNDPSHHVDKYEAAYFLSLLTSSDDKFTFQTFDDNQDRKDKSLVKSLHGTLEEHWDTLVKLSEKGAGVFVTINKTDLTGRKKENIIAVRALWRENDDGADIELPLKPQIVVESSPGKFHEYILVENIGDTLHQSAQSILAEHYGSDKNACDLSRVLRLPGFPHQKINEKKGLNGEKFLVRIVETNATDHYTINDVERAFGTADDLSANYDKSLFERDKDELTEKQVQQLKSALAYLVADDRDEWIRTGQNLKYCGDTGFTIWDDWAKTSDKYDPEDSRQKWSGFTGNRSDFRAIFNRAKKHGWINDAADRVGVDALCQKMNFALCRELEINDPNSCHSLIKLDVLNNVMTGVLWLTNKNKFVLIHQKQIQLYASEKELSGFIKAQWGLPYDEEKLNSLVDDSILRKIQNDGHMSTIQKKSYKKQIHSIIWQQISEHLKVNNQRSKIEYFTDLFTTKTYIDFSNHDRAIFTYQYTPCQISYVDVSSETRDKVIADYISHFPQLHDFIKWVVASRVAKDRKNSYLWLYCPSNWGKGFLLSALLESGLAVNMTDKELDKMLSGDPVGRSGIDFVHAFAIAFDEVKRVTGNHKLLQSYLTCTPKHEMTVDVPLYAKLYLSAENIHSLTGGDHGVEEQFANRFSVYRLDGNLGKRVVFKDVGNSIYHALCSEYMKEQINHEVQSYISMGKSDAHKSAEQFLSDFHAKNGIGNTFASLNESMVQMSDDILFDIADFVGVKISDSKGFMTSNLSSETFRNHIIKTVDGKVLLQSPHGFVTAYIRANVSEEIHKMVLYKTNSLVDLLGESKTQFYRDADGNESRIRGIDLTDRLPTIH